MFKFRVTHVKVMGLISVSTTDIPDKIALSRAFGSKITFNKASIVCADSMVFNMGFEPSNAGSNESFSCSVCRIRRPWLIRSQKKSATFACLSVSWGLRNIAISLSTSLSSVSHCESNDNKKKETNKC